jgi:hypothetical protein
MKVARFTFFGLFISFLSDVAANTEDKTITKVVKLLQEMLEKSKEEGTTERTLYAKFKCYCDTNDAEKTSQIETSTKTIGLLESMIEELQASSGILSAESAQLKADMAENEQARSDATDLRNKEEAAYKAEYADLSQAVSQMDEAIEVLSEVGSDQTLESAADHKKFMAGYNKSQPLLVSLNAQVKHALAAASIFLNPQQKTQINSFLQGPSFTGTYTAQSGQVVGILKDMRSTFQTNLEEAEATETKAKEAYSKFMEVKQQEHDDMTASYTQKQETLGSNDESLTSKKTQLDAEKQTLADAQEFLAKLTTQCSDKAKEYDERNVLRAQEAAAIAEAISILNSDSAFESFGTVSATSTGATSGFLQRPSSFLQLRRRSQSTTTIQHELERVLNVQKSSRLTRVLAAVEAGNPFETVLLEIEKMKKLNEEEGKEDKKNLDWCTSERAENNQNLQDRESEITGLEGEIDQLNTTINDPTQGLKVQIKDEETALVQNNEAQVSETKERQTDNTAYQADIKNLVDAEDLLTKAIAVLSKYYDELEKKIAGDSALTLAQIREDPDPPATWETYKGQSTKGNNAIQMLEYILSETKKEETEAHAAEEKAQADYEDSMTSLKQQESASQEKLAELHANLATAEKNLVEKKKDLKNTEIAKAKIEDYLASIKSGCDFITTHYDERETNRATEVAALDKAVKLIKATPAFIAAEQAAKEESYGKCKAHCVADEPGAECQACLAGVTVPGYCAGHPTTPGC